MKNKFLLTPLLGIGIFVLLYITAASLYPGGSKVDPQAKGFSLTHNYWCDLFDVVTPNGSDNPSRPIAIAAMFVLAVSFGGLWYLLPRLFGGNSRRQKAIRYTGMAAMTVMAFLFTRYHEAVINLGGLLGGIALTLTFIELYQARQKNLLTMGLICLALSCVNYFIYETGILLFLLASTQKIAFLVFFVWAAWLNVALYKKERQVW